MSYKTRLRGIITTCGVCRRRMARWSVFVNGSTRLVCDGCLPAITQPVAPEMGTD